jgi:LysR family transcriptional regulator, glycine cleavage system transcriptional activator
VLGVRMLDRSPRSVSLTSAGIELYEATVAGFAELSRVVSRLRRGPVATRLTLSSTTAFLSQWLVPRLQQLRGVLPNVDLRLHSADEVMPLQAGTIDVAIRYGKGPFLGVEATALRHDAFAPVCTPTLKLSRPSDIRHAKLLHVDGLRVPRPLPTWARWCAKAELRGVKAEAGLRFTDSLHAIQAAIAGHGVALVSVVLASDALASGLLVQPFADTLRGETYHFVCATSVRSEVIALRNWFREQMVDMTR